jgi:hypothetical protein
LLRGHRETIGATDSLPATLRSLACCGILYSYGRSNFRAFPAFSFGTLQTLPNLTRLCIGFRAFTSGTLEDVTKCTQLRVLRLCWAPQGVAFYLQPVLDLRALTQLEECVLENVCCAAEVAGLEHLRILKVTQERTWQGKMLDRLQHLE